ncbi:hypothetical protein J7413_16200 [Shimia sp. R10_1]|uniref:hypothetical protein n=1 Tax=Shimia sp. R10_1 TaxID=2821095 RepID=UPI001ADC2C5E|nr:hypothetical protein [Shimia sp. R10_1]MBO9475089.1 hypothetical protein [Shimia sp. R10_1]
MVAAIATHLFWESDVEPVPFPAPHTSLLTSKDEVDAKALTATQSVTSAAAQKAALDALFTPQGFDLQRVLELIDSADIGERQKAALKLTLEGSMNNPEFLPLALENAKDVLGY